MVEDYKGFKKGIMWGSDQRWVKIMQDLKMETMQSIAMDQDFIEIKDEQLWSSDG